MLRGMIQQQSRKPPLAIAWEKRQQLQAATVAAAATAAAAVAVREFRSRNAFLAPTLMDHCTCHPWLQVAVKILQRIDPRLLQAGSAGRGGGSSLSSSIVEQTLTELAKVHGISGVWGYYAYRNRKSGWPLHVCSCCLKSAES